MAKDHRGRNRPTARSASARPGTASSLPGSASALLDRARQHMTDGLPGEAVAALWAALIQAPDSFDLHQEFERLMQGLLRDGRHDEVRSAAAEWRQAFSSNPYADLMGAALSGGPPPTRPDPIMVRTLFDRFAPSFEATLRGIGYCGPELLVQALTESLGPPAPKLAILDAGCGTGLCANFLHQHAKTLCGVDLSEGMLALARQRQLYTSLVKAEVCDFLHGQSAVYDLIAAADVLPYFGDLEPLFQAAAGALTGPGWFAFTTEWQDGDDWRLTTTGRYSHSDPYLDHVLDQAGFRVRSRERQTLRVEASRRILSTIMVAEKA